MIKLQDFARDCGVTDRAIQKHLRNHEKQLEGHFQRRGKNGTWLDQTAQEYIRSLMVKQPIVVGDASQLQENEALRKKISDLQEKLILAQEQVLAGQNALMEVQAKQLALDTAEKEKKILEGFIRDAKAEIEIKDQELTESRQEARKALEEAKDLRERLEAAEAREKALDATLDEVSNLPLLKKLRWRRKV